MPPINRTNHADKFLCLSLCSRLQGTRDQLHSGVGKIITAPSGDVYVLAVAVEIPVKEIEVSTGQKAAIVDLAKRA